MTAPPDPPGPSLLDDPILLVERGPGSIAELSLPEVLAHLLIEDDPISGFPGLAAEQFSHWYRFLVRCATRALRGRGVNTDIARNPVPTVATVLREGLLEASGSEPGWFLHNPDLTVPAFMQPPIPGANPREGPGTAHYKEGIVASVTALLGSKNFERKSEAVRTLTAAELVYALLEFQGGVIYGGRGNYQTQLTPSKSGKGSGVPFMGIRLPAGLGATFQRDVKLFAAAAVRIRSELRVDGTTWALWTLPWDGEDSMPSTDLDPAFIPLARLLRVGPPNEAGSFTTVWYRTSSMSRVEDLSGGALFGDPFTPTIPDPKTEGSRKVRGVMDRGFIYPEVAELLGFGDRGVRPSDTVGSFFEERDSERRANVEVVFEGVAFEQGKTLGFHRRVLPLPTGRDGGAWFTRPEPFREAHTRMLAVVDDAKAILRASARMVLTGEPRPRKGDEAQVKLPVDRLDGFAEDGDTYLRALLRFGQLEREGDQHWEREWREWVSDQARKAFDDALPMLISPTGQRVRREADALNHLEARLWKLRGGDQPSADPDEAHDKEEATA